MNIVFIGASQFGLRCLNKIVELNCCNITGVVTAPETFSISYRPEGVTNVLYANFYNYCQIHKTNYIQIKNGMNDSTLFEVVQCWKPQMFIVSGWYHKIPKVWRKLAPAYGLHGSLLPDYSGGAPLVWAIINGEKKTGITFFQLEDGIDNGPIVGQKSVEIDAEDTIKTLYQRVEILGLQLIEEYIPELIQGSATLMQQDETKRRIFPQRSPEDGLINWEWTATQIYNFIRAQTHPYPGAFTMFNGNKLIIWKSRLVNDIYESDDLKTGEVLQVNGSFFVQTGRGIIELLEINYNGNDISKNEIDINIPKETIFYS
ncbi:methionyl-tRNA formyltransferase [Candidatus Synechococcus calcipolaris G9]|uniref:Methionyl-tRNA formyltransferase n=1 Tax=Candidatus Synechococcus calcipolaris G9 TaxID=1497997 RepID=A0ABT6EW32_9SYNE|nr:methionyl-tRNA formyltransferase [Candidatus Synechococcus calcipolaris]MDG2989978.1 methionyl-tRNA formyltransferase [Candidatus Synechococcus calcipolaris G9]